MGKVGLPIPAASLRLVDLAYRARLIDVEPTWFRFCVHYPIVVSSDKLRRELGWKPRYPTTESVLRALASAPSRPTRVLFGLLETVTKLRGSLNGAENVGMEGVLMEGVLNVVLTGDHPSSWHFWSRNRSVGIGRGTDPAARATVTLDEQDFVRLVSGELAWETATMLGKVRFSGDGEFTLMAGGFFHHLHELVQGEPGQPWPRKLLGRALQKAAGISPTVGR
jgi:hypothetical protein